MGVSKNRCTPKSSILIGFSHYKPSILGYPYFWKHPYSHFFEGWCPALTKQALAEEVRAQRDAVGSDVWVLARIRTGKMMIPTKSPCCSICKLRFIRNWEYLGCSLRLIVCEIPMAGWKTPPVLVGFALLSGWSMVAPCCGRLKHVLTLRALYLYVAGLIPESLAKKLTFTLVQVWLVAEIVEDLMRQGFCSAYSMTEMQNRIVKRP